MRVITLSLIPLFFFSIILLLNLHRNATDYGVFYGERDFLCPGCSVVLVSVDALRADHLGVYGYFRNTSPAIDDFAGESIVFDNAYAQAPWTLPSHMSIFTSLYPSRHGVVDMSLSLADSTLTLADVLNDLGYEAAAFTGGALVSQDYNYHTFGVFDDSENSFSNMLKWLDNNSGERFFVFWHTYRVHSPYKPSAEFDVFSDGNYSGIVDIDPVEEIPLCHSDSEFYTWVCNNRGYAYYDRIMDDMGEADFDYVKAKYDGGILEVDDEFSRLVSMLRKKGLLDNTVIVFTSDHGESFAEREKNKRIGHDIMYEEVLRVPLIVRVPGLKRQLRIKDFVESVGIMPAVLDSLGFESPEGLDGLSLFDVILNPGREDCVYTERFFESRKLFAMRCKNLKMIYGMDEGVESFELYDLEADPHERNNIFGLNKSVDDALAGFLFSRMPGEVVSAGNAVLEDKTVERLAELGYLV